MLDEGDTLADGDLDSDKLGERLGESEGLRDGEREIEALSELDGLALALGDKEILNDSLELGD